jgi:inhibitor of cysteine peptidase
MSESEPLVADRGKPFTIEVPSAPTTGYKWQLSDLPSAVQLQDSEFRPKANAAIGDGGTQVFHLTASEPGLYRIDLVCKRPWESDPVERKSLHVEVH